MVHWILGVFFDGGAYPYGDIRGERFLIVDNQGTREVSENWFWFTYWQGLISWGGIGAFFVGGALYELVLTIRAGGLKTIAGLSAVLIFALIWLFFVLIGAVRIAA